MQETSNIVKLRHLLAERFPLLRQGVSVARPSEIVETGGAALDELLGGGLPRGEFTELIAAGSGTGSAQVIHALLRRVAADGRFLGLVDGADSFDVTAVDSLVLARLLWVRCGRPEEAMKAADILLRDRNFPVLVLDLKLSSVAQLRRIPASTWYRFARLLEQNQTTVLVVTPCQLVSGAACRVRAESGLGIDHLNGSPEQIPERLRFALLRSSAASEVDRVSRAG